MGKLREKFKGLFRKPDGQADDSHPPTLDARVRPNSTAIAIAKKHESTKGEVPQKTVPKKDPTFSIRVDKTLWPAIELGENTTVMGATGKLFIDYTDRLAARWADGEDVGSSFGRPLFEQNGDADLNADRLPPLLFDLVHNRVVRSSDLSSAAPYAIVSYVWGPTTEIEGSPYEVDWNIPIRDEIRLQQILEAARVVVGERYIWLDVLCMDQRRRNEGEIAKMKSYFANATGCFVWLDNVYDDPHWHEVLGAIKIINRFFNLDQHGTPLPGSLERLSRGESPWALTLQSDEIFNRIREFTKLAKAPWFQRVWTLQEGIIPDSVYFCTPERYMTGGANIWTLVGLCETMAKVLLDEGAMLGAAVTHELQRSEIHKMLRLRQLYRRGEISYWHLHQGVRSRRCTYEQDRVFGVCGLIHRTTVPISINYDDSLEDLYVDLYRSYIDGGDFTSSLFLGGTSLLPDKDISMGYMSPTPTNQKETHSLALTQSGLHMDGIGIDRITRVHCLVGFGSMSQYAKQFPHFLDLAPDAHVDVARAFDLDPTLYKDSILCPASFAAFMSLGTEREDIIGLFAPDFQETLHANIPRGLVQWIKLMYLAQQRDDSAVTMIWTASSDVQLALVTEPLRGQVITVMPSSYVQHPGSGCLICQVLPAGKLKKVGVGLGRTLKAAELGSFLLVH